MCANPTAMKKTAEKPAAKISHLLDLKNRKIQANQEASSEFFGKYSYKKPRNTNNSNVGPAWGPRKGN